MIYTPFGAAKTYLESMSYTNRSQVIKMSSADVVKILYFGKMIYKL